MPLQRADTMSIISDFRGAGVGVLAAGLGVAVIYFAVAGTLVWYSTQVPRACNVRLNITFRLMGSLDGIIGVLMACLFLAAKGLVDAMSHGALAQKYESEGRSEEAEQQKEEAAKKFAGAVVQGCFPSCSFLVVQGGLAGTWMYGIMQAVDADPSKCGSAVTVFWVMLAVNVVSLCISCCLDGARTNAVANVRSSAGSNTTEPTNASVASSALVP